jgi:integrase
MAYVDVPGFVARLRERQSQPMAALALEFTILTAARSGEVRHARWTEIDDAARVWTLAPERTKAGREHRVPLSGRALAILGEVEKARTTGDYVFAGSRAARPLSANAMETVLRSMKVGKATVHGFRSAFRDWAGNETHFPREVAEVALAHVVGDAAEQAYRRGDALEKRRKLMDAWANFCEPESQDNVVSLATRKSG